MYRWIATPSTISTSTCSGLSNSTAARLSAASRETLATHAQIAFAAATTGTSNLVAGGIFRDPADLYDYIDRRISPLPGVRHIETAVTLWEVKRLAPVPT
ncbi:Lrp/AsnC ligand binding domain-containing protein [Kitasatospora sp. NPDC001574]